MDLLILGAGGHGRVVKEVAEATGKYNRIAFLDDRPDDSTSDVLGKDVLGKLSDYEKYKASFTHAFVAIGNAILRNQWQDNLTTAGYQIPVLIHPEAYVSPSAAIAIGTVVMPKAVIQANVKIGKGCIVSSAAIVDHDAEIGDYCHVNAGAIVAAGSRVESFTKVDYGKLYQVKSNNDKVDWIKDHIREYGKETNLFDGV